MPIITTNFDGISDELLNSNNSIITGYTEDEYASALNKLLENPKLLEEMQENAYKDCKSFYNSDYYKNNRL